jgi:8-oxo-dGTP diphosphatase
MQNIVPDKYLHVAVGVICRKNYILISKRAENTHQGNLWEFPGGKVESDETTFQALYRELEEELGIRIEQAEPLISIPFSYPAKNDQLAAVNVLLDVWLVSSFSGRPYGKEKQPIKWVDRNQLGNFSFPQANHNIIRALFLPNSYLITPDSNISTEKTKQAFINRFKQLCIQGYLLIQLRFKKYTLDESVLQELNQIADNYQVKLQFNSSSLTTYNLNCSHFGIHLTSSELHTDKLISLRKQYNGYFSASCHNEDDVLKANALLLDFITISPVNQTNSHPDAKTLGWKPFEQLSSLAQMPVYALGGMSLDDMDIAKRSGAQGIAAISALWKNN